jgi:hypothetical protein
MRPSDDAVYAHAININVAGKGSHPVVALWCMDCMWAQDLFQINRWDEVQRRIAEHCSQPSKREARQGSSRP